MSVLSLDILVRYNMLRLSLFLLFDVLDLDSLLVGFIDLLAGKLVLLGEESFALHPAPVSLLPGLLHDLIWMSVQWANRSDIGM